MDNIAGTLSDLGNIGSRAPQLNYNNAVNYLVNALTNIGCQPVVDPFVVPVFTEITPTQMTITNAAGAVPLKVYSDFTIAEYGGNGTFSFTNMPLHFINGTGCNAADFAGFPANTLALINMGIYTDPCDPVHKALNAIAAGVTGIVFIPDQRIYRAIAYPLMDFPWFVGDPIPYQIPSVVVTYTLGQMMLNQISTTTVTLSGNTLVQNVTTSNVYCTTSGDTSNLIVVGAHFDSVADAPGVNDDGSGSAAVLELATQWFTNQLSAVNAIQFSWWGAEEMGLIGSFHFVNEAANAGTIEHIRLNINLDMLGSPNGFVEIHVPMANAPEGTGVLYDYLVDSAMLVWGEYENTSSAANSDYYPFLYYGIPASGFATGASELKTAAQVAKYGGFENVALDPCYHQFCDTFANVNYEMVWGIAGCTADTMYQFAMDPNIQDTLGIIIEEQEPTK